MNVEHPGRQLLQRWGSTAWRIVGIMLAVAMGYLAVAALSGLVVPLLLAAVVGTLGVPLIDWLEAKRIPRWAGALLFIITLVAVAVVVGVMVVRGIIRESAEIRAVVTDGVRSFDDWLAGEVIGDSGETVDRAIDQGRPLVTGAASLATTVFSTAMAFGVGTFLALFLLYYILVDWSAVRTWVAAHLGVPVELGTMIVDDAIGVVRRGFGALTLTSLVTTAVIGLAMVVLDLPLVIAVTAVTFVTSFVPYLGAILSGAFGFLVALGAGGVRDAVILLIVILIAQNVIQTIVGNRLTSRRLALHPLPSIIASVCGVAIAGLLGAMLSAPALALAIAISRRTRSPEMVPGVESPKLSAPQGDATAS